MFLSTRKRNLLWHLLGVANVIFYEQAIISFYTGKINLLPTILFYIVDVLFFYLASYILIPFAIKGKYKLLKIPLTVIISLAGFVVMQLIAAATLFWIKKSIWLFPRDNQSVKIAVARYVTLLAYSVVFCIARYGMQRIQQAKDKEFENLEKEKERLAFENAFLRAQIYSHFLFNAHSYIKSLVKNVSEPAFNALTLVSEIMQYGIKSVEESQHASLENELQQVENYIELRSLIYGGGLHLKQRISIRAELLPVNIPPQIFTTCVENMFSHGNLHDADHPGIIEIYDEDDIIYFNTYNLKKISYAQGHGIGLKNIRRRLDIAFANNYELTINENSESFKLNLRIAP